MDGFAVLAPIIRRYELRIQKCDQSNVNVVGAYFGILQGYLKCRQHTKAISESE